MDENKEKSELTENEIPENENTVEENTVPAESEEEIKSEMEDLAKVFQQELDKTKAEAEGNELLENPELLDTADEEKGKEENPENLCQCCRENEKEEGKDYCADCLEAMRHYPFKWVYFVLLAVVIYVAVMAGIKIGDTAQGFSETYKGDVLAKAGYFESAQEQYQLAENHFYKKNIYAKMVYARSIKTAYKQGQITYVYSSVATIYEEWELNLPHMREIKRISEESQEFSATATDIAGVLDEYSDVANSELPYKEIIDKIEKFREATLYIGLDENGETTTAETTTDSSGSESSSDKVYNPRATKYHAGLISYYEYYVAKMCDVPYAERIVYLEQIRKSDQDKYWLYAADMGLEYAKNGKGDEANLLADEMLKFSSDDANAYVIKSAVARINNKDYDAALDYCDKGLQITENYELYRQKALIYLAKGDYKAAQEQAQSAYDTYDDVAACNTLALCALANKDTAKYDEIKKVFDDANEYYGAVKFEFSEGVLNFAAGKVKIEDIICAGGYDVI